MKVLISFVLSFFILASDLLATNSYRPTSPRPVISTLNGAGLHGQAGTYWFDGTKWQLRIRIGVYGLSMWRDLTESEARATAQWQRQLGLHHTQIIDWTKIKADQDAGARAKSLADFSYARELIENQLQKIASDHLTSDFLETRIELFFINEKSHPDVAIELLEAAENPQVLERLGRRNPHFLPVLYTPTPDPQRITPGVFDPFAAPAYIAHEIFHRIIRNDHNDGYDFWNYPLLGIMNGGAEYEELHRLGEHPQIIQVEWNTFLLQQYIAEFPEEHPVVLRTDNRFRPNYFTEHPDLGDSQAPWQYFGSPESKSTQMQWKVELHKSRSQSSRPLLCQDLL